MQLVKHFFASFVLLASSVVSASEVSYDFWEIGYVKADLDGIDANGFGAGFAHALNADFHIVGSYGTLSADEYPLDVTLTSMAVGIGYHKMVNSKASFFAEAHAIRSEAEVDYDDGFFQGSANDSETDLGIKLGLRGQAAENVELFGYLANADGETSIAAGALFNVNKTFQVGLELGSGDDVDTTTVFIRSHF